MKMVKSLLLGIVGTPVNDAEGSGLILEGNGGIHVPHVGAGLVIEGAGFG